MGRVAAAKTSEVPPGTMRKASAEGREIVVANIDGKFYAMDDTCTHAGASISEGKIEDGVAVCGWHGARFECATGRLAKFPAKIADLRSYPTSVEGEDILVEV